MKKKLSYLDSVHRDGRVWGIIVCILIVVFPVAVSLIYGASPKMDALAQGLFATLPMYWAVGIIEVFTYVNIESLKQSKYIQEIKLHVTF